MALLGLLIGSISSKLFSMNTTEKFFSTVRKDKKTKESNDQYRTRFSLVNYAMVDKLKYMAGCCFKLQSKHERVLNKGSAKIEHMLDLRSIIELQRASRTLQRLLLSKPERKLMKMQRRERVIEQKLTNSSSESDHQSVEATQKQIEFLR